MASRQLHTRRSSRRTSSVNSRRPTTTRVSDGGSLDRYNNHRMPSRQRRIFKPISSCPSEGIIKECTHIKRLSHQSDIRRWYDISEVIGHGNFSRVYLAIRRRDLSKSAIKQINKKQLHGTLYFVENEVDILKSCEHENICQLWDAFESSTAYILVFEFAPNGDLFNALKINGCLRENDASRIIAQVANALSYLHNRRIVHRDIKPENLLIANNLLVKLADFGLACTVLGPLYRICGTPTYLAPEVLAGKGYGIAVDIWSLGVTLHLMLVGYAPFRCTDRKRLFRIILRSRLSFDLPGWTHISEMAKTLVSKMLSADVNKRLTSIDVCNDQWVLSARTEKEFGQLA